MDDYWVIDTAYSLAPLRPDIDLRYSYFLIKFVGLNHLKDGTSNPTLSRDSFGSQAFPLPPLADQLAIATVLGTLEDKIELNRRMSETLEGIARAIFKSWFVDFDPVRAKMEGRPPFGIDAETAALFSDRLQDSSIGAIPKGWKPTPLSSLVALKTDRVDVTPAKNSERYVGLDDMPAHSIDLGNYRLGDQVNSSIISFTKDDILFGSMRPYFHKIGLAQFDGITRTTTFVLRPHDSHFRSFALFHLSSEEVVAYSTAVAVGSTIPYVKWSALSDYRVASPPDELAAAFNEKVRHSLERIAASSRETHLLKTLRDLLLPKLISGEIRVKDAEKLLGTQV